MINGLLMGFVWIVINCAYALGFWYGWKLTQDLSKNYSVGTIILVFFNIIIGVFSLGNAAPFISTFGNSRAAAYEVFQIIDRVRILKYFFHIYFISFIPLEIKN
jgi:ATP-binding cassette subfamily B (MDR/TAP) protein 1